MAPSRHRSSHSHGSRSRKLAAAATETGVLVVDNHPSQRALMRQMLADLEVTDVDTAASAEQAYKMLGTKPYGIVLCDHRLAGKSTGLHLLEIVREDRKIPADTIFIMVSSDAGYATVAASSEHKPDAYLLKPVSLATLRARLDHIFERRSVFGAVQKLRDKGWLDRAVSACEDIAGGGGPWASQALQLQVELLQELGQDLKALELCRRLSTTGRQDVRWTALAMARSHMARGEYRQAHDLLQGLADQKHALLQAETFDLLARCKERLGQPDGALDTLRHAADRVPSRSRLRQLGDLAQRYHRDDLARDCMSRLVRDNRGTIGAQSRDLVRLAEMMVHGDDVQAGMALLDEAQALEASGVESATNIQAVRCMALVRSGDETQAREALRAAEAILVHPSCNDSTMWLLKAKILVGERDEALAIMEQMLENGIDRLTCADRVAQVLRETRLDHLIEPMMTRVRERVMHQRLTQARELIRQEKTEEAFQTVESLARAFPGDPEVLLQAAQIACVCIKLHGRIDLAKVAQNHIERLEREHPRHPGVDRVRQYFDRAMD